ncbi:hypothetical protein LCGC14_0847420 [marine sediment metagenome]|uniref:tRNA-guanine(15) transglycosylase-like domain-containing protein n=1 Tax=marine sediment metagenome TaxID=412755 RepID=A0A0F9SIE5_9ZZZZ
MQKFKFRTTNDGGINQKGKIIFHNGKELETPTCWFGLSLIESKEFQLEVFKKANIEAFLSNAYDLYYTDKKKERQKLIKELQRLEICHKMDSGGFQLMKAEISGKAHKFPLNQRLVLNKQLEIQCECGVQLDFPFGPNLNKKQKFKRLNKTFKNLGELIIQIENKGIDFSFLPVIHTTSNDLELLEYSLKQLETILGKKPDIIGVGSLVPLVKRMKGTMKNNIENFLYTLISLRRKLPGAFIHAFGIGGTMAYLAILAGIDSYDSNGWIQKSAYGVIQLPGISDRFLRKEDHNRPYLITNRKQRNCKKAINEIDMFMKCGCEACKPYYNENWKDKNWKLKQKAFIGRAQQPKKLRAIHNVSLYQSEILRIREEIINNNLLEFIKSRLKFSIYYKYIDFIEVLKEKDLDELRDFPRLLEMIYNKKKKN